MSLSAQYRSFIIMTMTMMMVVVVVVAVTLPLMMIPSCLLSASPLR